ncbi:aminotransferase class IV [uncultured Clostridium sp.]|uniref:aminotransferase class IV n=1 Tax=uncultured Clostridium sp. TaxID=59620 RepID=UPI0025E7C512|nr:aminotransferase class IV [uncultured Clostridium sp.]
MKLDEGYMFGIGAFETIFIKDSKAIFIEEHLKRLKDSLEILGIKNEIAKSDVLLYINDRKIENGILKIMASKDNTILSFRDNKYTKEDYIRGFKLCVSDVLRNETSKLTYIKSFNYGDNILEKQAAKSKGYDEPIFLNTKGYISEGATTNIFFIKDNEIYTPRIENGLLNGIIRQKILEKYKVKEVDIRYDEIGQYDEVFITNSVLSVMPVKSIDEYSFTIDKSRNISIDM